MFKRTKPGISGEATGRRGTAAGMVALHREGSNRAAKA
jgi:hypothetical protein